MISQSLKLAIRLSLLLACWPCGAAFAHQYDVVIYGGTSAAVTAAIQTAAMGHSVVIVSPDRHLGGMTTGGLGQVDAGRKESVGGLARTFHEKVYTQYDQPSAWNRQDREDYLQRVRKAVGLEGTPTMWKHEPHVAEQILESWLAEFDIDIVRDAYLDRENGVVLDGARIRSIETLDGQKFEGEMFIDVTYEGDLMAAAGVDYTVGRESNATYDETFNGNQVGVLHHAHFFAKPVDPFVVRGDQSSGLLPRIGSSSPGQRGEADDRVQAYCYRMCLTDAPENRLPFEKPDGYDAGQYELLLRVFETGWNAVLKKFDPMPNRKTDTNNHGPFSTDNIGMSYDYPDASYARRREIIAEHETYQKGLMYFMQNDPRVPEAIRETLAPWGLCRDEFTDSDGWPHQIYVREARRMVGQYVVTEHDVYNKIRCVRPIALGSYTMDSHNVRRYVTDDGLVQNEGDIGARFPRPYGIDYHSILPRETQCENLAVPVCLSASHIAFGSIRMEPIFMMLGQSAATAAVMSIERETSLQQLPYDALRERLLRDGQRLESVVEEKRTQTEK